MASSRLFEFVAASMLLLIGLITALPGVIHSEPLALIITLGVGENGLAFFLSAVGSARLWGLWASHQHPISGPHIRALGSAVGSVVWLELGIASLWSDLLTHHLTPAVAVCACMCVGEAVAAYRSIYDAGRHF